MCLFATFVFSYFSPFPFIKVRKSSPKFALSRQAKRQDIFRYRLVIRPGAPDLGTIFLRSFREARQFVQGLYQVPQECMAVSTEGQGGIECLASSMAVLGNAPPAMIRLT